MHSFSETPYYSTMYKPNHNEQTLHTYCYSLILFIFYLKDCSQVRRSGSIMKNASASGSSKNQMLPSLLPLLASFFKVLPLPQKFNRFHIPAM